MPARMIINTESMVGYNNKLKQAVAGMKLGVNNEVNSSTKRAVLKLMADGPSKINPPNSHPSNPIHMGHRPDKQANCSKRKRSLHRTKDCKKIEPTVPETPQHQTNKTAIVIGVVGLVALLFMAWC